MHRPYSNGSNSPSPTQSWFPYGNNAGTAHNNDYIPYSPQASSTSDMIVVLRNKSTEELQRLLSDQDAYSSFLQSLDTVKQINSLRSELVSRNVELAKQNLEKESDIFQLKNQCTIIRSTELAAAHERFNEARKKETDLKAVFSPGALLERLQDAANKVNDESEDIYQRFVSGEMNMVEFMQTYRKMRYLYHMRTLTRLAARTSSFLPG